MNEPKRRGRPPKASIEGADVSVRASTAIVDSPDFGRDSTAQSYAQLYARRVWDGQSESLTRHERLGRVAAALAAQGLSMEGVEL